MNGRVILAAALLAAVLVSGCATTRAPTVNPNLTPNNPRLAHDQAVKDAAADNVQLGMAYMQRGNLPRAKEKLDRALKQDPSNPNVYAVYGLFYERVGDQKRAEESFRTAMRMAPDDPGQVNTYAGYLCRQGRVDEGVTKFVQAVRNAMYRTPEIAYTNMGVCLRSVHRDDEAAGAFQRALAVKADDAEAVFQLADLDLAHGRALEARTRVERFMSVYAATPDLLLLGVRASRVLGDAGGVQKYSKILRADYPGSPQTQSLVAAEAHGPAAGAAPGPGTAN